MPLVKCPDCGKMISDRSPACIGCGAPLTQIHIETSVAITTPAEKANDAVFESAELPTSTNTREFYGAFLGDRNREYYLAKFLHFDHQGHGLKASWNWPALLTGVWPLYRKMYGWFFVFWGILVVSSLFEKSGHPGISFLIIAVPWVLFAVFANALYHNKVKQKIATAQLAVNEEQKIIEFLRRKGGVNTWVPWLFGGLVPIGILAAIAVPNYLVYKEKAKSAQLNRGTSAQQQGLQSQGAQSESAIIPKDSSEVLDANSQFAQGMKYYKGEGVKQDYSEAARWWRKAAEQGEQVSQNNLGKLYYSGEGVPRDYTEAAKWFRLSATQGQKEAQNALGVMCRDGNGVQQNFTEAAKWFKLAAAQGHKDAEASLKNLGQAESEAQTNRGWRYEFGKGVRQDYSEAAKWYRKAAERGHAVAQNNLGVMYASGNGVPQDYAEAASWYRKAAEQGLKESQFGIGLLLRDGNGVQQDNVEAIKWLRLAAAQGHADAKSALETLGEQ